MPYTIIIPGNIEKSLKKLPRQIRERILKKIWSICDDPFRFVEPVAGTGYHRLRARDYRIIMRIERGKMIITVLKAGDRKSVYDGMP